MTGYNKIEREIARFFRKLPWIKDVLKRTYQLINYIIFKKKYTYKSSLPIIPCKYKDFETFFGYYDKSPENITGEYMIYHASKYPTYRLPNPAKPITIVLHNLKLNTYHTFSSSAYNWQQGSKLQWIEKYKFIFNDFNPTHNQYISKIVDAQSVAIIKELPFPIYDVNNSTALFLNFNRLHKLRPDYGYRNIKQKHFDDDQDGIFIGNIDTGEYSLLYSISQLKNIGSIPSHAIHKVNHIMFAPDGNKFLFLHRYFYKGQRFDRLMLGFLNGDNPILLSKYAMVSHYFWLENENVVAFMEDDQGDQYYQINTRNFEISPLNLNSAIMGDGHPNVYDKKMIFDTYPDKARMKSLFIFDMKNNSLTLLGEFFEPLQYNGQTRCDLHPRWNFSGNKIFIDSTHSQKRQLYYLIFE